MPFVKPWLAPDALLLDAKGSDCPLSTCAVLIVGAFIVVLLVGIDWLSPIQAKRRRATT